MNLLLAAEWGQFPIQAPVASGRSFWHSGLRAIPKSRTIPQPQESLTAILCEEAPPPLPPLPSQQIEFEALTHCCNKK